MREIKFRAWLRLEKKMCPVLGMIKDMVLLGLPDDVATGISVNQVELMQYTGLKDKHGKEIYEGDIIRVAFNNEIAEEPVEYQGCTYIIELQGLKVSLDSFSSKSLEIIGNINENPDLLETL